MKISFIFIILILVSFSKSFSQNIFNEDNTFKFAKYLFDNTEYKFASEEFNRLAFLCPENKEYKLFLLKSYRLSENYTEAISVYQKFDFNTNQLNEEFAKNLFLNNDFNKLNSFLNENDSINIELKNNLLTSCYLIEKKYDSAFMFAKTKQLINNDLLKLSELSVKVKYKKTIIASSLSLILPGTGKIYTGNWKDGMFSLSLIAANSFLAYRGFSNKGIKSVYGWTFASIAFGFYIGNIYGSVQSAKKYNNLIDADIRNKTYNILLNSF